MQRVKEQTPDITFVDVKMPVMDGFLFISKLREDLETFQVPVVLVTTSNVPEVTARAEALGVKNVLTKPSEPQELDLVISQALERLAHEWDIDEESTWQMLDGSLDGVQFHVELSQVASVAKMRYGAKVELLDGRSFYLSASNDVNWSNKGIEVTSDGRTHEVGWRDFVEFRRR